MKYKNNRIKSIRAMILLIFCALLLCGQAVFASEQMLELAIPVRQYFEIKNAKLAQEYMCGQYKLTAKTPDAPMPKGSKASGFEFEITGSDVTKNIDLSYEHAGIYEYNLLQVSEDKKNYKFDRTEYKLVVYIKNSGTGGLVSEVIALNGQGSKSTEIGFKNLYEEPKINENPPDSSNPPGVQTGDDAKPDVAGLLLGVASAVIGMILIYKTKR